MRNHQSPGGERHELPRHQEGKGVVRHDDQVHRGDVDGIERQHAMGRVLVLAVAEREQACSRAAEVDDNQEECGKRINTKVRTEPRQPKRQSDDRYIRRVIEQMQQCEQSEDQRNDETCAVYDTGGARGAPERDRHWRKQQEGGDTVERVDRGHLMRTPRPPPLLVAPSPINSMPCFARASTSFINESTLPRTTPSLDSMR